jgi:Tol biopolymer transport system component
MNTADIYITNEDGSKTKELLKNENVSAYSVRLMPEKEQIVFTLEGGTIMQGASTASCVGTVDLNKKSFRQINDSYLPSYRQSSLSSNGKIVFEASGDIFIMDADGSNFKNLTQKAYFANKPTISPDGNKIVFRKRSNLCIMDTKDLAIKTLLEKESYVSELIWSSDSKKIAFNMSNDIYIIDVDGSNMRNITNTPHEEEEHIAWVPIER